MVTTIFTALCGCKVTDDSTPGRSVKDQRLELCPLHATAPTLLTTLQLSLVLIERHRKFTQFDDDYFTVQAIEAAIAKAKGE